MSEENREEEKNFWASSHKPALSQNGENIANILNKLFGSGDDYHNIPATRAEMAPKAAPATTAAANKPRPSPKGFRMASDQSVLRQVNSSDALLPQDQSMQPGFEWLGKNMESALGNKTLTHPDMSALPLYRETGRQYQRTWGEQTNPDKTLAPYTDQSSIPLAQAALRNPQNTIHENHARETGFDQGIEKGAPTSLGADFLRGGWHAALSTGKTIHNAGITGADLLFELSGGDETAIDQARQNKIPLAAAIEKNQEQMRKSREQLGEPGSEEYRGNHLVRQIAQGGGGKAAEAVKQSLNQRTGYVPEAIATTSELYHAHEELTGEKRIGKAIKQGVTATAFYSQAHNEAQKIMEKVPLPGFMKDYLADQFASNARDEYIRQTIRDGRENLPRK